MAHRHTNWQERRLHWKHALLPRPTMQEEQLTVVHQMGAGLLHERQQRQQLQAALAALQARVQQLAGAPAGPANAAPPAAAPPEAAQLLEGQLAEDKGPGSGHVADSLAMAGSSGALL